MSYIKGTAGLMMMVVGIVTTWIGVTALGALLGFVDLTAKPEYLVYTTVLLGTCGFSTAYNGLTMFYYTIKEVNNG